MTHDELTAFIALIAYLLIGVAFHSVAKLQPGDIVRSARKNPQTDAAMEAAPAAAALLVGLVYVVMLLLWPLGLVAVLGELVYRRTRRRGGGKGAADAE